jgi:hypothetical protein
LGGSLSCKNKADLNINDIRGNGCTVSPDIVVEL